MLRRHRDALTAATIVVALAFVGGCSWHDDPEAASTGQVRVEVANVGLDHESGAHYVQLEDMAHARALQILIGEEEARAIMLEMHGIKADRPLTHDLLRDLIEQTGNHVDRVVITAVRNQVYYADIYLDHSALRLDSRPSDAIALAMGMGAPIFVASGLFESAAALAPHQPSGGRMLPATITVQNIVVQDLSPALAMHFAAPPRSGVVVAQVSGLAARAGLMCGDLVTAVDKHPVRNTADFAIAVAGFRDPYVSFSVMRGPQARTITILREAAERGAH